MPSGDRRMIGGPQTREELDAALACVLADILLRALRADLAPAGDSSLQDIGRADVGASGPARSAASRVAETARIQDATEREGRR